MCQLLFRERRVLWTEPTEGPIVFATAGDRHCCDAMRAALVNACAEHADDPFACADMLLAYSDVFDEYGLIIHDGSASVLRISHCPFCGKALPESRRDEWFDRLEAMGFSAPFSDEIPEAFRTGAWRRQFAE
jgi:hypothetical protein